MVYCILSTESVNQLVLFNEETPAPPIDRSTIVYSIYTTSSA